MFVRVVLYRLVIFRHYSNVPGGWELGAVQRLAYYPYDYYSVYINDPLELGYTNLFGGNIGESIEYIQAWPFRLEEAKQRGYQVSPF